MQHIFEPIFYRFDMSCDCPERKKRGGGTVAKTTAPAETLAKSASAIDLSNKFTIIVREVTSGRSLTSRAEQFNGLLHKQLTPRCED